MEERVLHYIFYFERITDGCVEEEKGILVEVKKLNATRELLEKNYQLNRLKNVGITQRITQYLIDGVNITMPFEVEVETRRYNPYEPRIVLTSERENVLEEIAKKLDLPFDRKKVKR